MGNFLQCCYLNRKSEINCNKCNLKYNINIRTCPHHKFSKNTTNKSRCYHCKLKKSNYGDSLCYHNKK